MELVQLADLDVLIDSIYRAGADATQWDSVLAILTDRMNGLGAALHVGDIDCSGFAFGATHNLDPEAAACYAEYYFSINPLNRPLTHVQAGEVVSDQMLLPRRNYRTSEFYNDFALRFAIEGSATAILAKADGQIACLGVVQPINSEPYSKSELALLKRLVPHLQRAIDLNRQLAAMRHERDEARAALDLMELAVLFLGEGGTVLRANRSAEELFRARHGLSIRGVRLRAAEGTADARLQALINGAVNGGDDRGGSLAIPRLSPLRPLMARVVPYVSEAETHDVSGVRAFVFVRDPEVRSQGSIAEVASAYGLTRSETRLVQKLLEVGEVTTAADELEISTVTARNHLARAMAKTETNKQAELVRVILSSRVPVR